MDKIKELFEKNHISNIWEKIESKVKNSIKISLVKVDESEILIGQSKIGGSPDLPKHIDWFQFNKKPMSFIAQINLSEINVYDLEEKLPKKGMLYFFYDAEQEIWGFDPKDKDGSKVLYIKDNNLELERKTVPENLDEWSIYNSCKLEFKSMLNIPNCESNLMENIKLNDEEFDAFNDVIAKVNEDDFRNKLLGHSDNVQGGMELECELVTNNLYCGDGSAYEDPKAKNLEKNVDLWNLLLQIDSNDEANMGWGDVGRLYFWIRENDLKEEKFENSWVILQCY
jgi:uncharacterized protein YwqG